VNHDGFQQWVTLLRGMWSARVVYTRLRSVSNQVLMYLEVGRVGGDGMMRAFRSLSRAGQSVRAQLGESGALLKRGVS